MKTILSLIITAFLTTFSFAQSGFSFKIYQNTDIFQTRYIDNSGNVATGGSMHFGRISLAINLLRKKGLTHEVEILIPEFSKPINKLQFPIQHYFATVPQFENEAASYSIRYEIDKLLADKSERIDFLFGVGLNPYYVQLESTPNTPNAYFSSLTLYGVALNATPRLYYKLNRFFSIDLNVPIRIYNFQREKYRQDNPILTTSQQRRNQNNHLFFEPVYTIRLGLRYSLNR